MLKPGLISFLLIPLLFIFLITGCGPQDDLAPLPESAKQGEDNQLLIPFPFTQKFSNGTEQWVMARDNTGGLFLKVTWREAEVAAFPLERAGDNPVTGEIALGGRDYAVIEIHLHNDLISGWATLQER